jgi:serine/threonine protein kinase
LSMFCGTPCYMDPDLVKHKKYSGQGADVWALGIILFLLLTGGVPYWGETEQELYRRICAAKYALPKKGANGLPYSKKVKNLLDKIFVPNVNNRITAEKMLDDPWLRVPGEKGRWVLDRSEFEESKFEESKTMEPLAGDQDEMPGPGEYIPSKTICE